ncbi:MAG: CPBP family intramembrane glutamic endopeptidase [Gammaproteobacteria bacterium]
MRALFALAGLLVLILLCGALLSFPIYELLQPISDFRFHKVISRVTSLSALLLILAYVGYGKLFDRETLGYAGSGALAVRQLLTGYLAGMIIMIAVAAALVLLGIHQVESDLEINPAAVARIVLSALITGTLVGLFEETLFRGALLGGLLAKMKPLAAVLISSTVYAAGHFLKYRELPAEVPITWTTGLEMIPGAFYRFGDPATLDAFLSLLAFGVLLSLIRLKNSAIYQCIGLHAGAVTAIKIINKITDYVPDTPRAFMVNPYDHMLGYLALVWLLACILIYYYRYIYSGAGIAGRQSGQ